MPSAVTLERVRREFSEWRSHRVHRQPIPDELWAQALELSTQIGISPTCRELHLNHTLFKRYRDKVASSLHEKVHPQEFLEILQAQSPPSAIHAEFTLDGCNDRRLSIRVEGAPLDALAQFARQLISTP